MSFEEFKNEVERKILGYLSEDYKDAVVRIHKMEKNNTSYEGLTVLKPNSNISPCVYLDAFYEMYQKKGNLEMTINKIAIVIMENEVKENFDLDMIREWEKVKGRIIPRLICAESNKEMLSKRPYTLMEDLAITYHIYLEDVEEGYKSIPVTNKLLEMWDVTTEELLKNAKVNQRVLTPAKFIDNEAMIKLMTPKIIANVGVDRKTAEKIIKELGPTEEIMYVLTNEREMDGAAAILNDDMMEHIKEMLGEEFYILPSSIHELIIIKAKENDKQMLKTMVNKVNTEVLQAEEKLTDSVYRYNFESHLLERV